MTDVILNDKTWSNPPLYLNGPIPVAVTGEIPSLGGAIRNPRVTLAALQHVTRETLSAEVVLSLTGNSAMNPNLETEK